MTKTPQSTYSGPVVVDPLTRIEGHLRIEVEVENGKVKDARSCGTLFRGLETIVKGRDPRDVQHFTARTCGVCTYTHALASTRSLEDAIHNADKSFQIPANATYIRNLLLAQQQLHDHIVHFYHLHALDFVDITSALKADPAKAAKLAENTSGQPCKAEDLKAVQDKLNAFVASGQLGPFANALADIRPTILSPKPTWLPLPTTCRPCACRSRRPAPQQSSAARTRIPRCSLPAA